MRSSSWKLPIGVKVIWVVLAAVLAASIAQVGFAGKMSSLDGLYAEAATCPETVDFGEVALLEAGGFDCEEPGSCGEDVKLSDCGESDASGKLELTPENDASASVAAASCEKSSSAPFGASSNASSDSVSSTPDPASNLASDSTSGLPYDLASDSTSDLTTDSMSDLASDPESAVSPKASSSIAADASSDSLSTSPSDAAAEDENADTMVPGPDESRVYSVPGNILYLYSTEIE